MVLKKNKPLRFSFLQRAVNLISNMSWLVLWLCTTQVGEHWLSCLVPPLRLADLSSRSTSLHAGWTVWLLLLNPHKRPSSVQLVGSWVRLIYPQQLTKCLVWGSSGCGDSSIEWRTLQNRTVLWSEWTHKIRLSSNNCKYYLWLKHICKLWRQSQKSCL